MRRRRVLFEFTSMASAAFARECSAKTVRGEAPHTVAARSARARCHVCSMRPMLSVLSVLSLLSCFQCFRCVRPCGSSLECPLPC